MKRVTFTVARVFCVALASFTFVSFAQSDNQNTSPKPSARAGSISGRVVNESGRPMPNARVFVNGSSRQGVRRMVSTDEAGRFVADDLPRGTYAITVQANGYVLVRTPGDTVHHRPGDSVNLVLKKGAAITGTVTNSDGNPVVGVPVTASMVRDEQGRRNRSSFGFPRYTDDRGVYRLFGLPGGTYVISAGFRGAGSAMLTPYGDESPTYYPSSTRDAAAELAVTFGAEITGIDIRYRGERGQAVSGTVIDQITPESLAGGVSVMLFRISNDTAEAQTSVQPRSGEGVFALYGVPDGDYYLIARRGSYQSDDGATSKRVPLKVRGHDITGVAIDMVPSGSIAGRLSLDLATKELKCETQPAPAVEETLLSMSSDEMDGSDSSPRFASVMLAPDAKGDFVFQGLPAGRYRIDSRLLLDEAWYVRAITVPGPTNTPVDVSTSGIAVKPGRRINGVRLVLGEGAASIRGRVLTARVGGQPDRLRVHLVPAEPNAGEATLRFIEAEVQSDSTFKLLNVAPGRYWLIARKLPDEDPNQRLPRPQTWDSVARTALRREAAASNVVVELKPCQRMADYELRFAQPKDAPPSLPKRP